MKQIEVSRRRFIGRVSTACATMATLEVGLAAGRKSPANSMGGAPAPEFGKDLVSIQNEAMRVEVDRSTGAFRLTDRLGEQRWEPDPWLRTAGILVLERAGGRREINLSQSVQVQVARSGERVVDIQFTGYRLPDEEGTLDGQVKTRLSLLDDRGGLRVEVLAVDHPAVWNFVELSYPCRLGALFTDVDDGYLVVPYLQGCLVPSTVRNWKELPHLKPWAWDDGPWMEPGVADLKIYGWYSASMPFFGAVKGGSALLGIVETENDAGLRLVLNSNDQLAYSRTGRLSPFQRLAVTSPFWLAERKRFSYPRSILYEFLPRGDYASMAKRYRAFAAARGLLVTLREKIEKTPALATIIGGPWVHLEGGYPYYIDHPLYRYTWNEALKFVDDLTDYVGVKQALLTLWIGYQNLPPDSYPFHPAQGTRDELRGLIQHARQRRVLINFYHGYSALLDDSPNGDPARARKLDAKGAMGQRWGRHCPAFYLTYAKKNLPPAVRDSGMVCDYTDILTASTLGECWDARHPLTRAQDRQCREETMKFIGSLGLFSGSEWPTPYAMPYLAYFRNGGTAPGTHLILSQFPVPLLNLVFKDCALMYGQNFPTPGVELIRELAAGCHLQLTFFSLKNYHAPGYQMTREGAKANVRLFQDWNQATGLAELLTHQFDHELNGPYRTRFSDGSEALVNPTTQAREMSGAPLPPESIILRFADGRTLKAAPAMGWNLDSSGSRSPSDK